MSESSKNWASPITQHIRSRLLAGVVAIVPVVVTFLVVRLMWRITNDLLLTYWHQHLPIPVPAASFILSIILTVLFIYGAGIFARFYIGRQILSLLERIVMRIPLVSNLYTYARDVMLMITVPEKQLFRKPILVAWPSSEMLTPGFVTNEITISYEGVDQKKQVVYVTTPPSPVNGWLSFCKPEDLKSTSVTSEEVVQSVVSGGLLFPNHMTVRPWSKQDE